jgi:hypothetical protein
LQTRDHIHLAGLKSSVTSTNQVCLSSFRNQLLRNKQEPEAGNSSLTKDQGEKIYTLYEKDTHLTNHPEGKSFYLG